MIDSHLYAAPMSRNDIRSVAQSMRDMLGFSQTPWLPIVHVLEYALDRIAPEFIWDVQSAAELGDDHGLTDHASKVILLRQDVYLGAVKGNGRDRGTVAHEIGHAILHGPTRLARRMPGQPPPPAYRCVEWQAKAFAGELLVDCRQLGNYRRASEIAEAFGVSLESAGMQLRIAVG